MFGNLENTQIAEASEEDLLVAGGDPKDIQKTDAKPEKKTETKKTESKTTTDTPPIGSKDDISDLSDEVLEAAGDEEEEDDDEERVDKSKDKSKDKAISEEDDKVVNEEDDDTALFLKARVDHLITKGEWAEIEDRDKIVWTEDNFAEMELTQRAAVRNQMREELLDSFGPYGRSIANFAENGGDPDDLLDIFTEQQKVIALDDTTEEGQKAIVFKYLTEVNKFTPEKANKKIASAVADKELEEDAKNYKGLMEAHLKKEAADLQTFQKKEKDDELQKADDALKKFSSDITNIITSRQDIPAEEKEVLKKVLTKFKTLDNGQKVNDFYSKFIEFRKDQNNYVDFVRFVLDPNKFKKKLQTEAKNLATEKAFSLARSSNKAKKAVSTDDSHSQSNEKKSTFKLMY